MKITVSDYITYFLNKELGIKDVFMLTGGGAMFLNDSFGKHKDINVICNHHEQASSMGAVAYSKYKNDYSVVCLTTGCGCVNSLTGLIDAWQDNLPCIFISGQVKISDTIEYSNLPLRQVGVQEVDIINIVKSITKYSVLIKEANTIKYHLQKASYLAKDNKFGPVWIDLPLDIQSSIVYTDDLIEFSIPKEEKKEILTKDLDKFKNFLESSKRPIVIGGNGVRLSGAIKEFKDFIKEFNIPLAVSYLGLDLFNHSDDLYIGSLGNKGTREANFAVANADLIIVLGSKLHVSLTGYEYSNFARDAKIIVIDIDENEHKKKGVKIDYIINSDIKYFLNCFKSYGFIKKFSNEWVDKCKSWKEKWAIKNIKYEDEGKVNKYTFIKHLNKYLKKDSVIIADAGSAGYVCSQALSIDKDQRYILPGAQMEMGFTLPALIGVYFANKGDVIGITGDGSFQMNIQELQTIKHHNIPAKIFVWNNNGYLSIRSTQKRFFNKRYVGTDVTNGVSFPSLEKITKAYDIKFIKINNVSELDENLKKVLSYNGPVICEVMCPENQEIIPTTSSIKSNSGKMVSKPMEDMYPFLDREEFLKEMIIRPLDD